MLLFLNRDSNKGNYILDNLPTECTVYTADLL